VSPDGDPKPMATLARVAPPPAASPKSLPTRTTPCSFRLGLDINTV
jgi:hypothetical protein